MPDALHVLIVYGSVRSERKGIGLARFLEKHLAARGCGVELADPLEIRLPLLDRRYAHFPAGEAPEPMARMAAMIGRADAVLVVSGEYNHGIPPALKNMLDHYLEEWRFKPAGIACYSAGRYGGVRAAMQLRMTLAELGMPTVPSLFPVPNITEAVNLEGEALDESLAGRADRFLDDLLWWASAARAKREESGTPY